MTQRKTEVALGDRLGEQGRFEVEHLLGEGAFGEVFRGRDHRLGRPVAIKHLLPAARAQRDAWQRFLQEAKILARLAHPHIIQIFDILEDRGCIVLELAAGGSLESIMEREKRLPVHRALELTIAVLGALEAVHAECIWHRDLKPANILLDANGTVKLSDFGIAHAPDGSTFKLAHTMFGQPGTPVYMSPEQIQGIPIDGRSDLWAVAVILYQMLTGFFHLPFWTLQDVGPHELYPRLREMITKRRPRPPSSLNATLPSGLDDLVMRGLALDPADRYESAREMLVATKKLLRRLPDVEEATALPEPPARREVVPPEPPRAEPHRPEPPRVEPPPAPSEEEQARIARAREALGRGDAAEVMELLGPGLERGHPLAAHTYAEACVKQGAFAKAVAALEQACAKGGSPESWLLRVACLRRAGRGSDVIGVVRDGCTAHPQDATLREALAVALKNAGQTDEAIAKLREAIVLDPSRASMRRLLKAWGGADT